LGYSHSLSAGLYQEGDGGMTSVVGIFDKKKTETKEQEEKNKEGWEEYKADLLKHLSEEMEKEGVHVLRVYGFDVVLITT